MSTGENEASPVKYRRPEAFLRLSGLESMRGPVQVRDLRSVEDGIAMASRYFATVLRATLIPCSDRIAASLLSLSGLEEFSAAMSFFNRARIAVEEHSAPLLV